MKKIIFVLFVFCTTCSLLHAGVPNEIRYNGRLKSYQEPVNGVRHINFRIYESESDTPVWQSGVQNINVSSGIFSYIISPGTQLDLRKGNLWLELVVDGKELAPKEKLTAQPYALHSRSAENISSNNEIKIEIGNKSLYLGIDDAGKPYFKASETAEKDYFGVPAGTVIAFAGPDTNPPKGYLLCNGATYNKADYPDLFNAIGTIYGGDGASNFKVPDFKGVFLRGFGETTVTTEKGGTVTVKAPALGIQQTDAIRNIYGTIGGGTTQTQEFLGEGLYANGAFGLGEYTWKCLISGDGKYNVPSLFNFNASNVVPTANENRPVNYSVNYCIKY